MFIDLRAELRAAIEATDCNLALREWREPHWPRRAALMGLGGGIAQIEGDPFTNRYEPVEVGGQRAIIIPVWGGPAPAERDEQPLDLVAWTPGNGATFTRLGVADVLGEWHVWQAENPLPGERPVVRLYSNPGRWAAAAQWGDRGGHGAVLIDPSSAWRRLGHVAQVIVDDIALGRRLKAALRPPAPPPAPQIAVAVGKGDAAA